MSMTAAQRRIALWREDYRRFVTEELHVQEMDKFQEEALIAASGTDMKPIPRIAMKASKGPGKTAGLAWIGWASMATRPHLNGACISITADNLRDNLWKEFAKWQSRSEFLKSAFTWNKTRIYANDHEPTWWLSARTFSKNASAQEQSDALAGLHADQVLVLADESGGYPSAVMATADAVLSSCVWGLVVQAGNPTHLEGPLYEACTSQRAQWVVITINGDPENPDRASRVSKKWAQEQIDKYGKDNPWVLVNVFGQFPPASLNALLGPEDVEASMKRYGGIKEKEYNWHQKRIGCDTARFGDDPNVFAPRQGLIAHPMVVMRNKRGPILAARVSLMRQRWGGSPIVLVDDTGGYGATLIDSLDTAGISAVPVNFGGLALDPRYANRRAEMYWNLAEWVLDGGALPPDPEIVAELTQTHYTYTKKGQLILEDKDIIKETIGRSPNKADALALTFALPEEADMQTPEGQALASIVGAGHRLETNWPAYGVDEEDN